MFSAHNLRPVFLETVVNLKRKPHTFIDCIPVDAEMASDLPIYYHKAINDSESEWSQHRKLIKVAAERNISSGVPAGFAYFHVDFFDGHDSFAHHIEDEKAWPRYFGQSIVGKCAFVLRY